MPDAIMYEGDAYVVLETGKEEQLVSSEEMLAKLEAVLGGFAPDDLPRDLRKFSTVEAQARELLENSCELDVGEGEYLQWYLVRLEK